MVLHAMKMILDFHLPIQLMRSLGAAFGATDTVNLKNFLFFGIFLPSLGRNLASFHQTFLRRENSVSRKQTGRSRFVNQIFLSRDDFHNKQKAVTVF